MLSPFYMAVFLLSPGAMSGGGNTVCKGKMGSALVQDVDPKELNTMENTLEKVRTWVFEVFGKFKHSSYQAWVTRYQQRFSKVGNKVKARRWAGILKNCLTFFFPFFLDYLSKATLREWEKQIFCYY